MSDFEMKRMPAVHCGIGALAQLPESLAGLNIQGRVFVVADAALAQGEFVLSVLALLNKNGHTTDVHAVPVGEPKEACVRDAIAKVRADSYDAVICIGGGSTLDTGKLVACIYQSDYDVAAFRLAAKTLPRRAIPLICIPTTSGTGSEATSISVIAQDDNVKNWFAGPGLSPDLVILDPRATVTLPSHITAITGMDALVHAIEAATTPRATELNNVYAYRAIKLISNNLRICVSEPNNLVARSAMQEAAMFAGVAINNAGTGIAHNIGHALGSLSVLPHGRAVAIGLCAALEWNIAGNSSVYKGVAEAMNCAAVDELPAAVASLAREAGVHLALSTDDFDADTTVLAQQMMRPENIVMADSNSRPLEAGDFLHLAEKVLTLE